MTLRPRFSYGGGASGAAATGAAASLPFYHLMAGLWFGQSNDAGTDTAGVIDHFGLDRPHPKVVEFVQPDSIANTIYRAAPVGTHQVLRDPVGDDRDFGISSRLAFGRSFVEAHPDIERLMLLCRATGETGFYTVGTNKTWNPGDALYNGLLAQATAMQDRYRRQRVGFIACGLGGSEPTGTDTQDWIDALAACIEGLRSSVPRAEDATFVMLPLPDAYAASSAHLTTMAEAQREAARQIPNSVYVSGSGLYSPPGNIAHYDAGALRELGRRMAQALGSAVSVPNLRRVVTVEQPAPDQRMQYDAEVGDYVDINGSPARIYAPVLEVDDIRGTVLRCNRQGFDTSLLLNDDEYTIALWVRRMANPFTTPDTQDFFVMGKVGTQAIGLAFARTVQGHHDPATAALRQFALGTPAWDTGSAFDAQPNPLLSSNWCHLVLTFKEGTFACYRNGVSITAPNDGGGTYPAITGPRIVQIGAWGALSGVAGTPDMRFDDIIISPRALSASEALALYNDTLME